MNRTKYAIKKELVVLFDFAVTTSLRVDGETGHQWVEWMDEVKMENYHELSLLQEWVLDPYEQNYLGEDNDNEYLMVLKKFFDADKADKIMALIQELYKEEDNG